MAAGVGLKGIDRRAEWRVGLSFAGYQVVMPVLGLGIGRVAGSLIGAATAYVADGGLILLGIYLAYLSRVEAESALDLGTGWGLTLASLTVSLDALAVGFILGVGGLPVLPSLAAIGLAAFLLTFLGLRFGAYLGRRVEALAQLLSGISLALLGAAFLLQRILT